MARNNATVDRIQAVWNKLGGEKGVDRFLRGEIAVTEVEHVIDCDAQPFIPDGWTVVEHRKGGKLACNSSKFKLHFIDDSESENWLEGSELRRRLSDKPLLNANVLDFLLANKDKIPEEWRRKFIYFWGTIYCDSKGSLYVRFLAWNEGARDRCFDLDGKEYWTWQEQWIGGRVPTGDYRPIAVRAR